MSSTSVQTSVAGRQVAPLVSSVALENSLITPIPLVWARRDMIFESQKRCTTELLELYAEEMFISEHSVIEEAIEALLPIAPWNTSQHLIEGLLGAVPTLVDDEQQVCRPQLAVSTTLLFDAAAPVDNDDKIVLRKIIYPDDIPATVVHDGQEAALPHSPALDFLDANELFVVHPTLASDNLSDSLSPMLDFDSSVVEDIDEEIIFEYTPTRPRRSLLHPPPVYSDAELNELQANETHKMNKQSNVSKRRIMSDITNETCPWEFEYDRVLRQITGQAFLPGIEHLTTIEARSAFVTYDSDIQALQQATAAFADDRRDSECLCLDDKIGSLVLPGENFLLAENNTDVGLSMRNPTAESLFSLIDGLIDSESLVEDPGSPICHQPSQHDTSQAYGSMHVSPTWELPCDEDAPRPGTFFNIATSQYTGYTSLDQIFAPSDELYRAICAQFDVTGDVSDILDEEIDELSAFQSFVSFIMSHHFTLNYFDADSQQAVAYIALNQLLLGLDDDETMPRIQRPSEEYDDDYLFFSDNILEIDEHNAVTETETLSPSGNDFAGFDFGFGSNAVPYQPHGIAVAFNDTRAANDLHLRPYSQRRRSRMRPVLAVTTQLNNIDDVSSAENLPPSSSSSDESIDFTHHRGLVQKLWTRRTDFLDDEDSGDLGLLRSATPSDSLEAKPSCAIPKSNVSEYVGELFSGAIWQDEAALHLTFPVTLAPHLPLLPADGPPDAEILSAVETEVLGLIAYMFECIQGDQLSELQALGSDLLWAVTAITDVYPSLGLMMHLATTVEILLERCVALGMK
ncbi:hypothetical protein BDU57DRAFT_596232 [Ampelomyces quisqualis]|uniref:Uncharacterized protein n=1 Tax=Ampelomyces quisqualis TaxID=50730 RepID=A0A6A5QI55_AMPQU|nr:hypothetical protein BDU57DRAFT_596232 [Ampelomyces quisqualis]